MKFLCGFIYLLLGVASSQTARPDNCRCEEKANACPFILGMSGLPGPAGQKGDQGLQGPPGKAGPAGLKGDQGPVGERGLKGDHGGEEVQSLQQEVNILKEQLEDLRNAVLRNQNGEKIESTSLNETSGQMLRSSGEDLLLVPPVASGDEGQSLLSVGPSAVELLS